MNNRLDTVKSKLERLQINAGEITEKEANHAAESEAAGESAPDTADTVLEQAAATLEEVDESNGSADLSETSNRRNTAVLESGINRLAEKGNEAISSLADLIHAYNENKINDSTVRTSGVRFRDSMKSTAFISRAVKVAGPVGALGLILSLLLIVYGKSRTGKD